jgi:hypothetical protein
MIALAIERVEQRLEFVHLPPGHSDQWKRARRFSDPRKRVSKSVWRWMPAPALFLTTPYPHAEGRLSRAQRAKESSLRNNQRDIKAE